MRRKPGWGGAPGVAGGALEAARLAALRGGLPRAAGGGEPGPAEGAAFRTLQHLWHGDLAGAQAALAGFPSGEPGAEAARDLRGVLRERALDAVGQVYDTIRLEELDRLLGGRGGAAEACAARGWEVDAATKAVRVPRAAAARPSAAGRPASVGAEHIQDLLRYCVDPDA